MSRFTANKEHAARVELLSTSVKAAKTADPDCKFSVHKTSQSHTPYEGLVGYKAKCAYIDLTEFVHVLDANLVDAASNPKTKGAVTTGAGDRACGYVVVEGSATIGTVCDRTLKLGVTMPVVCEFSDFTVGGLISGLGMQAASHRYGLFHDTVLAMEVLLGDGSVVVASPTENADLYYNLPGSFGTMGIVLAAVIQLVPCKPYVISTYLAFRTASEFQAEMSARLDKHEFLEGIVVHKDLHVIIYSDFIAEPSAGVEAFDPSTPGLPYYDQHVAEQGRRALHSRRSASCILPVRSFLFRYERGIWWLLDAQLGLPLVTRTSCGRRILDNAILKASSERGTTSTTPQAAASTRKQEMQAQLGDLTQAELQRCFVTQGFIVRTHKIAEMLHAVHSHLDITPLWVCGAKVHLHGRALSQKPWLKLESRDSTFHVFDVGAYGEPMAAGFRALSSIRALQKVCDVPSIWGMNYMPEGEIGALMDFEAVHALRRRCHAINSFPDILTKVRQPFAVVDGPKLRCWRLRKAKLLRWSACAWAFVLLCLLLGLCYLALAAVRWIIA